MRIRLTALFLAFIVALIPTFFNYPPKANAATTPSLGTAATFGILSSTFTRNGGVTAITGDLGYTTLSGGGSNTVTGTTHVADATYTQAGTDQGTALTALNAQSCDFTFGSPTDLSLESQPLAPGVYCISAATSIGTGGITLSGSGTYIFRITGALTTVDNSDVTLTGGATACNVFWTPTAATTLGANTTFSGTVIDDSGITVGSTTSWTGRALAFGETVTTDTDTITVPSCTTPTSTPTPTPTPTPIPTGVATPTPTSTPSSSNTSGAGDGLSDGRSDGLSDGLSSAAEEQSITTSPSFSNTTSPRFPNTGNPRLPDTGIGPDDENVFWELLARSFTNLTVLYLSFRAYTFYLK